MLRTETQHSENGLIVRLEGRLAGNDAEEVPMLVTRCNFSNGLIVDLTGTTFVDPVGEATLSFLSRLGAKFVVDNVYALDLCERLQLAVSPDAK